jgi:hypothetical protein
MIIFQTAPYQVVNVNKARLVLHFIIDKKKRIYCFASIYNRM